MKEKLFKIRANQIKNIATGFGAGIATDSIMVDGNPITYMYREKAENDIDSGWRFFSGLEDQDYVDNPDNLAVYNINTIANYTPAIIPYLNAPVGAELEYDSRSNSFKVIE